MKDYEINRTILTSLIKSFTLIYYGSKISGFYVSFLAILWNENFREFVFSAQLCLRHILNIPCHA